MKFRGAMVAAGIALGLFAIGVILAKERPERDEVKPPRHPNLDDAQNLIDMAFNKISAAQQANEWDWDGHAARAKELLAQANYELRQAEEAGNRIRRQITLLSPPINQSKVRQSKVRQVEHLNAPGPYRRVS